MKIRIKKLMASILCTILLSLSLIPPYIPKVNAQEYPTYAVVNPFSLLNIYDFACNLVLSVS